MTANKIIKWKHHVSGWNILFWIWNFLRVDTTTFWDWQLNLRTLWCYGVYGLPLVALTWLNLWYFLSNTRMINVTPPIAITVHLVTVFNWSRVSYINIKHSCYYLLFLRVISYWSDPLLFQTEQREKVTQSLIDHKLAIKRSG